MNKKYVRLLGVTALFVFCSAQLCTKVVTYASKVGTDPVAHEYSTDTYTALEKTKKALDILGYEIVTVDESRNQITTGWKPVTSDSHYMNLFGRPDYAAADGAYYQVIANISQTGSKVEVSLSTNIQSVAGKLSSSKRIENDIFKQINTYLRSPQIIMTNVGVQER